MFKTLKRTHRVGAGIAGAFAHSLMKYRRIGGGRRNGIRSRYRTRFRKKTYQQTRRKRRFRRRKRAWAFKKRNIRKARKRGAWQNFTSRRTEQVSLAFILNADTGPDDAIEWNADQKWFGNSKDIKQRMDKYRHHWMKSISFKFNNFKFRTLMRTVTTEGTPPQEFTTEQVIEPSSVKMRYKWNKWGETLNPGHLDLPYS